MVDGLNNSVVETDIVRIPAGTGSSGNFAGNAFVTQDKVLKVQNEGARDFNWETDRRWKITNPARKHYSSGRDVGYAIVMKGATSRLLAREDGWIARRAAFTKKSLWVVKDVEDAKGGRMWPAGKYVPQTREEPEDSVGQWVKGGDNIENEDVVLYLTVGKHFFFCLDSIEHDQSLFKGTTHIPRPEDWPVMPVEHVNIIFKPNNFFAVNPSMDVPGTKDSYSRPAFPNAPATNGANGDGSRSCCAN